MTGPDNENQIQILESAVQRFMDSRLDGQEPEIDEFVKEYPGFEEQVRQRISKLHRIDGLLDSLVRTDDSDFQGTVSLPDLVGQKLGSFEVGQVIGRGGMGVVYLAHDTKLKRSVAIKSMPVELQADSMARTRFRREAELLASLNHPNIAAIHDILEQDESAGYLILEYVPGETLAERVAREPLRLPEALSIGQQVAEAVSAAHDKNIVHRDLKPGNIKITPEGKVKVLDFGLAKASVREDKSGESAVTQPGRVMGTPAYMSPEQAHGKSTDLRTDIWSFGCIMYEMLTGHSPFESDTATDTLARIIEREPDWEVLPQETPPNIRTLLRRCLEKNPQQRLRDIGDAALEIRDTLNIPATTAAVPVRSRWRWAMAIGLVVGAIVVGLNIDRWREQLPAGPGRIESLAVLPLEYLSGDPNREYFAEAMTDELIGYLGKIGDLGVICRQSVMQYKGSDKPLPEIAQDLNVDALVVGTVLCGAEQVRIRAELISAVPERRLWGDKYEDDFGDILILSSEVAQAIAHEVQVTLTPEEEVRLISARPVHPEAYKLYRRGKDHLFKWGKKEWEKAIPYFQQAIEVDPNYAQAYAGLASSYGCLAWAGHLPLDEVKSKNRALLRKALELDNTLAEAHFALAADRLYLYWDRAGAEEEMRLAIALNPNLAEAHFEYAYILASMGRFEESITEAKRALQLDPLKSLYKGTLAYMYYLARQYDQSIAQDQHLAELQPKNAGRYSGQARTYEQMGRYEDAVKARQKALSLRGAPPEEAEALARAYSEEGPKGYWMWRLEQLEGHYENRLSTTAVIYAQLGDKDQAFAWLEKAYESHNKQMYRVIPASLQNLKKVCGGVFLGGAAGLTAQPISGV